MKELSMLQDILSEEAQAALKIALRESQTIAVVEHAMVAVIEDDNYNKAQVALTATAPQAYGGIPTAGLDMFADALGSSSRWSSVYGRFHDEEEEMVKPLDECHVSYSGSIRAGGKTIDAVQIEFDAELGITAEDIKAAVDRSNGLVSSGEPISLSDEEIDAEYVDFDKGTIKISPEFDKGQEEYKLIRVKYLFALK